MNAICTEALTRRYNGDVLAVDNLQLTVQTNTIHALLGPNGAGKTTTISMLTTLLQPTSGSATVAGYDVVRQASDVRHRIGVTFQEMILDVELTGRQVLDYHGRLYRQPKKERQTRIEELLALVELEDAATRPVKTYSGGMKRRLELARGLMTRPDVLFLDEPTTGLDPQNRASIWEYIRRLKEENGLTLLLTTHYMDEAEQVADCVSIIDYGRIVAEGTPRTLIDDMGADTVLMRGQGDCQTLVKKLQALPYVESVTGCQESIQVGVDAGNRRLPDIIAAAIDSGYAIEDISVRKPDLGDVFLKFTGRQLRDK